MISSKTDSTMTSKVGSIPYWEEAGVWFEKGKRNVEVEKVTLGEIVDCT